MAATAGSTLRFRPDIEGLRAAAVLLVIAFHYDLPTATGGFIGVDVFFVISGYLITSLIVDEIDRSGSVDLIRFYGRRGRRLLPAVIFMIAVVLAASYFVLSPFEQENTALSAIAASLYVSNFWFANLQFHYFATESSYNPLLHTWSLAVEEQFYFVWPTLLLLLAKLRRSWIMPGIAAITMISFCLCLWLLARKPPLAFYASPARAWEFGIGALALVSPLPRSRWVSKLIGWAGLAVILASATLYTEYSTFPNWTTVFPVVGTAALLIAGRERTPITALLGSAPMQWIGKLSYSLYLWHWPVIVLAAVLIPEMGPLERIGCGLLSLCCAALSYYLIENPVRHSLSLIGHKRRSIMGAVVLTLAGVGLGGVAWSYAREITRAPEQVRIKRAAEEASALDPDCIVGFTDSTPKKCLYLKENKAGEIVLVGDSHAAQLFTPVAEFARSRGMRLSTYLKASCPVSNVEVFSVRLRRVSHECTAWRAQVLRNLTSQPPQLVVISQHSLGYVKGPGRSSGANTVSRPDWIRGLTLSISTIAAAGPPIILIADTPRIGRNIVNCLSRAVYVGTRQEECARTRDRALDDKLAQQEAFAARELGTNYIHIADLFCSDRLCPATIGTVVAYRDSNHISESFARQITPELIRRMRPAADLSAPCPSPERKRGEEVLQSCASAAQAPANGSSSLTGQRQ